MQNRIFSLTFFLVVTGLNGCQQAATEQASPSDLEGGNSVAAMNGDPEPKTDDVPKADPIQLREGNWPDVLKLVSESAGKVVVVDIWSLSCAPCLKEFPGLVSLHNEFPEDVVCVGMAADYTGRATRPPSYYEPKVRAFLTTQKAHFPNFQCNVDSLDLFGSLKLPSIPAVVVFDRDGNQVQMFDSRMLEKGEEEPFSYSDDIRPFVAELVSKSDAAANP